MSLEAWFLTIGGALGLSILGSRVATKLGVPVLLFFLAIGMLAGSDGPGGIWFDDAALAQNLGVVALVFILFSGGMDLDWRESKPHFAQAFSLATVGVFVSAGIVGLGAWLWLGFSVLEGLLLGAIIASTDAAAVFSTLGRFQGALRKDLRSVLEMESGSNDPAAIFLTIALIAMLKGTAPSLGGQILNFLWQMACGAVGGWLVGRIGVILMRRLKLDYEGLYHGLSIAVMAAAFGGITLIGGNGFLAVYVAGVTFGNGEFRQRKGLRRFHDGLAWLMQIMLFIVLGLLVFPRELPAVVWTGIAFSAFLMLVARPLGVLLALAPFRVPLKDMAIISWCGLRGAVPIVLATFPMLAGLERSQEIFNMVFFVVLFSAALQGPTIPWLAQKLGVGEPA